MASSTPPSGSASTAHPLPSSGSPSTAHPLPSPGSASTAHPLPSSGSASTAHPLPSSGSPSTAHPLPSSGSASTAHPPTPSDSASIDRLLQQILRHLATQQQQLDRLEHGQHNMDIQVFLLKDQHRVQALHFAKSLARFNAPTTNQGWLLFLAFCFVWGTVVSLWQNWLFAKQASLVKSHQQLTTAMFGIYLWLFSRVLREKRQPKSRVSQAPCTTSPKTSYLIAQRTRASRALAGQVCDHTATGHASYCHRVNFLTSDMLQD
ncbi:hypothetical protein BCR37DRAFT_389927 [Protomyces lactucae-debilis]|uniref:Uncharacterized protein n=1 Tax=Protomyces lactucae-debilis TaxID=2754530 RepID=A0A1Y2ERE6_PROLT|nr:uncharacterized protein BCR37DRAFT_389927 [Protomyces lactucae-debilis]ORY74102.1 hypothetical protein BCR37DRAFT_389927 [Protomyces lactucae-debilis]